MLFRSELKSIEGLITKKLVKKSSKGKAPARYALTKAAHKHLPSTSPAATAPAEMPSASPTA